MRVDVRVAREDAVRSDSGLRGHDERAVPPPTVGVTAKLVDVVAERAEFHALALELLLPRADRACLALPDPPQRINHVLLELILHGVILRRARVALASASWGGRQSGQLCGESLDAAWDLRGVERRPRHKTAAGRAPGPPAHPDGERARTVHGRAAWGWSGADWKRKKVRQKYHCTLRFDDVK